MRDTRCMTEPATPRVPLIGDDTTDARLSATYDHVRTTLGRIPNVYRTLGHNPALLDAWLAFAWPLRHAPRADRTLRELVIMRTAQLTSCDYEWRQHWSMAIDAGVTEAQLSALSRWPDADDFSPAEKSALRMADELAHTAALGHASWAALRAQFSDVECVELVLTASFYSCVSRVLGGLAVPLEPAAATRPPVDPLAAAPHLFDE